MPIVFSLLLGWLVLQSAQADTSLPESQAIVAELQLDGAPLLDTIYLQQSSDQLLLPMGELARLLGIGVRVDAAGRGAEGFLLDERVRFRLDVESRTVQWANRKEYFTAQQVRWIDGDFYVASALLQRWWPIDASFDPRALSLQLRARQKLPVQWRLEREREAQKSLRRDLRTMQTDYPLIETAPRGWSFPAIDSVMSVGMSQGKNQSAFTAAYSATLAGDLLGMEALAQASIRHQPMYDNNAVTKLATDLRLILARHDPQGRLLGKLRATSVQLGQLVLPPIKTLPLQSATGWGVLIGNHPLDQPSRYGVHSLRGWLPEGWDVTLFFNDTLAGFALSTNDGIYEFIDQPLFFGRNEFRLEFNGPQGQRRVEKEVYWLDQQVTEPGAAYYRAGLQNDELSRTHALLQGDLGVAKGLALTATVLHTQSTRPEESMTRGHAGLRASLFGARVGLDQGWGARGERSGEVSIATRVRGVSIHASQSAERPGGEAARRTRDQWRVSGALPLKATRQLPYTLSLLRERTGGQSAKESTYELEPRIYLNIAGWSLAQSLLWRDRGSERTVHGTTRLIWHSSQGPITAQGTYRLSPHSHLDAVSIALAKNIENFQRMSIGLNWTAAPRAAALTLGWWRNFRAFGIGVNLRLTDSGNSEVLLQWSNSLVPDTRAGTLQGDARPRATTGAVFAKVFLDANGNGRQDANEQPIEQAGFTVNGGLRESRTDASGTLWLAGLRTNTTTDIALDATTLEDARWQPALPGLRIVPRAGHVQSLDFPVVATSDVEGRVLRRHQGMERSMAAMRVWLLDEQGTRLRETRSLGEGYFLFESLRPGRYRVALDPQQLAELGLALQGDLEIEVEQQGGELRGVELIVTPAVNPLSTYAA